VIATDKPDIIFEWHPLFCLRTGNEWSTHFEVLSESGYTMFLFFTKFGEFGHFMNGNDRQSVSALADLCINSTTYEDWHYDVIALHSTSALSPRMLADAKFAHSKQSPF
ncbi:MAG: FkbM family methyltransferase, partial [Bacteroidota bacterium]